MSEFDLPAQAAAVRSALAAHGIRHALAMLNDRTQYRYTAIYKLSGDSLKAVHVFDRASEYRTWLKAVPLQKSFCQHAIEQGEFATGHVSKDRSLVSYRPFVGLVESYYGRLLTRGSGVPYGTFIHFDLEPRVIDAEEVAFLQQVTPMFLDYLD
ncbi:hypothetical protein J7E70_23680 [Variovorax paradoxus]|nr:hypothetical protein [Variovorax paradoxus]MBT2303454.1 hypothetical protein [Variovorax paradoxus]